MQTENTYVETDLGNIALNPRGEYSDETSYEYLDTVSYMGGSYVCLAELTKTISGIAPEEGKNTEHWQMLTLPGQLTPEAVAMHDDVVNKTKRVETSRAAVELSQQEIEAAQADVTQMRKDTQEASQTAIASRDSAAGYAQSAEASRTAAAESEQNINAQVTGFDTHVTEKTSAAETAVEEARKTAINAITTQQDVSTKAVTDEGTTQTKMVGGAGNTAVSAVAKQQAASVQAVEDAGTAQVTEVNKAGTTQVENVEEAGNQQNVILTEAAAQELIKLQEVAKQFAEDHEQIETNKEDISNKITKFYASNQGEIHITDSDNGKIQDMMIYGKSSQDGTPTTDNPVEIKSVVEPEIKITGKNLLPFRYKNGSKTENGVTFDVRNDGTIHIYGTANAITYFNFTQGIEWGSKSFSSKNEKYKLCDIGFYDSNNKILSIAIKAGETVERILKPMVVLNTETDLTYEPYHEQTATLPYVLNAIPVNSGGNVTINGQQYVADYVDVERGKVVRMCERETFNTKNGEINEEYRLALDTGTLAKDDGSKQCIFSTFKYVEWETCAVGTMIYIKNIKKPNNELYTAQELKELSLDFDVVYQLLEQQEIDLTPEENKAFKALVTNYPATNISVTSNQLDGYTVFNYPISMENGWNYVKQQIGDTRDYIYDMDIRTHDTDLQAAEAYVNSEYAVALTELEV